MSLKPLNPENVIEILVVNQAKRKQIYALGLPLIIVNLLLKSRKTTFATRDLTLKYLKR